MNAGRNFRVVATSNTTFPIRGLTRRMKKLPGADYVKIPCATEDEIIAAAGEADAVIAGTEPYTARVIRSLGNCLLICSPKVGYDNIDVSAATEAGILVTRIPDASTEEVAEHALALILACARRIRELDDFVRSGRWDELHGAEIEKVWKGILPLRRQTLGLVGFGRIPRAMMPGVKGLGFRVLAHDPFVKADFIEEHGAEAVSLDDLLREADYISLHCALTPENRHLMGEAQFRLMKPTACLINTARGGLVDEAALCRALIDGEIAAAALDVLETEPVGMDNPLLDLENVIFTGHSAHYSDDVLKTVRSRPVEDVAAVMDGNLPEGLVNPEVADRARLKRKRPA